MDSKFRHLPTSSLLVTSLNYNRGMSTVQKWLFAALIFFLPSNLFFKVVLPSSYVHGLLSDYLIPKLYLTDLLIGALLVTWGISLLLHHVKISAQKQQRLRAFLLTNVVVFVVLALIQLRSPNPIASLLFLLKLLEFELLAVWVFSQRALLQHRLSIVSLIAMLVFQSCLGMAQFATNHSVFPSYLWLGESRLFNQSGIAQESFSNVIHLLPYGTTSHPNVLAGVLAIGVIILMITLWKRRAIKDRLNWVIGLALLPCLVTLWLTQSWSAWLSLAAFGVVIAVRYTFRQSTLRHAIMAVCGLVILVVSPFFVEQLAHNWNTTTSFTRRDVLNQGAVRMFAQHPLLGIGLNVFTQQIENYVSSSEVVRFIQPAHNVALLMLAEEGLLGVGLELVLFIVTLHLIGQKNRQVILEILPYVVFPFIPLLIFDHFLWTQQVGQLIGTIGTIWLGVLFASHTTETHSAKDSGSAKQESR